MNPLKKHGITLHQRFISGELIHFLRGKTLSEKTKQKIAKSKSKYIEIHGINKGARLWKARLV